MPNTVSVNDLLDAALRAAQARQAAIANNIANLNTPGYRRSEVAFEDRLAEALDAGEGNLDQLQPQLVQPMTGPVNAQGNDVNLDEEVGGLVRNTAMYKTYIRLLGRTQSRIDLAMKTD